MTAAHYAPCEFGFGLPWKLLKINVVVELLFFFLSLSLALRLALHWLQCVRLSQVSTHESRKKNTAVCERVGTFLNGFKRALIHSIHVFVRSRHQVQNENLWADISRFRLECWAFIILIQSTGVMQHMYSHRPSTTNSPSPCGSCDWLCDVSAIMPECSTCLHCTSALTHRASDKKKRTSNFSVCIVATWLCGCCSGLCRSHVLEINMINWIKLINTFDTRSAWIVVSGLSQPIIIIIMMMPTKTSCGIHSSRRLLFASTSWTIANERRWRFKTVSARCTICEFRSFQAMRQFFSIFSSLRLSNVPEWKSKSLTFSAFKPY